MKDIWDEKPEPKIVGFELNEYDKDGDPLCATVHHYDVLEMDAWLNKIKSVLIDDREKIHFMVCRNYQKRINKLENKLSELKEDSD